MKVAPLSPKDQSSFVFPALTLSRFLRFTDHSAEVAYQRYIRRKALPTFLSYPSLKERVQVSSVLLTLAVLVSVAAFGEAFGKGHTGNTVAACQAVGILWVLCTALALSCLVCKVNNAWRLGTAMSALMTVATVSAFAVLDSAVCSSYLSSDASSSISVSLASSALVLVGGSYLLVTDSMLYGATSIVAVLLYLGIEAASGGRSVLAVVLEALALIGVSLALMRKLYTQELAMRQYYAREVHEEPTVSHHPGIATPSNSSMSVATDWDDILSRMQNVSSILTDASSLVPYHDLRLKLKIAAKDLGAVTAKLVSEGPNIFQVKLEHINQSIDREDKLFVQQNFMTAIPLENSMRQAIVEQQAVSPNVLVEYQLSELMSALSQISRNWNFDMFFVHEITQSKSLSVAGRYCLSKFSLYTKFSISDTVATAYFQSLEQHYKGNPYHNSCHAADVLSSTLYLYQNSDVIYSSTELEVLGTIVAALGHDVGHPALTNRFLINSRSNLSLTYNDYSVLEMMHTSLTFSIMNQEDKNIFKNLESDAWVSVRKTVIKMILATDMSRHFELLGSFKSTHNQNTAANVAKAEDRLPVYELIIKCADIGHAAKSLDLHERWTVLVCEEFFQQGDKEKELGLPVSMYCDRANTDIAKSQMGFILNIVLPLYESLNVFLESREVERCCVQQLRENMANWERKTTYKRRYTYKVREMSEELLNEYEQLSAQLRQQKRG